MNEELPAALSAALSAACASPGRDDLWDEIEELLQTEQHPEAVCRALVKLVGEVGDAALSERLAQRGVRLAEEWGVGADGVTSVLRALLRVDATVPWAFERMTMALTVSESWGELLDLYDRAIAASEGQRRRELLDEAAQLAKDFAGQPDRAVGYMEQIFSLRPTDAKLAATLERLLEQRGRWAELINVWNLRTGVLPVEQAQALRLRVAEAQVERLGRHADAVEGASALLADHATGEGAAALLERVGGDGAAEVGARSRALSLLRGRYGTLGRKADELRVVEALLLLTPEPSERVSLHRHAALLHEGQGDLAKAFEHHGELLLLDPDDDGALGALRRLGERLGLHEALASRLSQAAEKATRGAKAIALWLLSAEEREVVIGDAPGAASLFAKAFWHPEASRETLSVVGPRLDGLLERTGQKIEQIAVLERLAADGEVAARTGGVSSLLGKVARLSSDVGDLPRALAAWEARLAADAGDIEARDARIDLLERMQRHEPLLEALRRRADEATSEDARRADLVRVAKVVAHTVDDPSRAISAWLDVEASFGRSDDTVDALADLYAKTEQGDALASLVREASASASAGRRAELGARLGGFLLKRGDAAGALDAFVASAEADPRCKAAREGLTALLGDERHGARAVAALTRACADVGDDEGTLGLVEQRLRFATGAVEQTAVLVEAATLAEQRQGDLAAATAYMGRAFALAPVDERIEAELLRLAPIAGAWQTAKSAYVAAIASLGAGDAARVRALRYTLGEVAEQHLGDERLAYEQFATVHREAPQHPGVSEALLRTATRVGEHQVVAAALCGLASSGIEALGAAAAIVEQSAPPGGLSAMLSVLEAAGAAVSEPAAVHALFRQMALWYLQGGDDQGAERALLRATREGEARLETLELLARIQRARPGEPLVDTLERLHERGGSLEALREAATVALDAANDVARGVRLLERLVAALKQGWAEGGDVEMLLFAIDRLGACRRAAGAARLAIDEIVDVAALPMEASTRHDLLHRAADLAEVDAGDAALAIELSRRVLAEASGDERAIERLSRLFHAGGMLRDLLALRRHELGLGVDLERRLALRCEIARIALGVGELLDAMGALRENLAESPGHGPTIELLVTTFEGAGRLRELVDMLVGQAQQVESAGRGDEARALWVRAGVAAETKLSDVGSAVGAFTRASAIAPSADVLDALGRLSMASGDARAAVRWLEQRLAAAEGDERIEVVARLCEALVASGQRERARLHLERELSLRPSARGLRAQLAQIYRASEAWPQLVRVVLDAAMHEDDTQAKLGHFLEAADIQQNYIGAPAEAVSLLERALELSPQDRSLRVGLADALRGASRLDEAKAVLDALANEYGRRRPPERAAVHYQLALLSRARGDIDDALAQLDTATSMDMSHPGALHLLGVLARGAGQLERAERALRALLLVLRRMKPEQLSRSPVTHAEVLFELSKIASHGGNAERAEELLASAFESAAQSAVESSRFERQLRASGDLELLLRSMKSRLAAAQNAAEAAQTLAEIAATLEQMPGRAAEALEARLSVLDHVAEQPQRAAALASARAAGALGRYADKLDALARRAEAHPGAQLGSTLALELADLCERELADLARARDAFERAARGGDARATALRGLDRVSKALGDDDGRISALTRLSELLADDFDPSELIEVLYVLAALQLAREATLDAGISTLSWALDREPRRDAALGMLARAAGAFSHEGVFNLFERVARESNDQRRLLEALERLATLSPVSQEVLREGVELAAKLGEGARAEALLRTSIDAVERAGDPMQDAVWSLVGLADRRAAAGDAATAVGLYERAADASDADEAFRLRLEVARLAEGPLQDPVAAIAHYERLWAIDPADRRVWERLIDLHRKQRNLSRVEQVISGAAEAVTDAADRRRLRMERVDLLVAAGKEDEAIPVLQRILDDEPDDADAAGLLMAIYERRGDRDDLAGLLYRKLDGARARRDEGEIVSLSLRLGELITPTRRAEAMQIYRDSLAIVRDERHLLQALLSLFGPGDDPVERADLMETLLSITHDDDAARLSLALADLRAQSGDDAAVERALSSGIAQVPENPELHRRLEAHLEARGEHAKLAELLVAEAGRTIDPALQVERLRRAAAIFRTRLSKPRDAAAALSRARPLAPDDQGLLRELVAALLAAGDSEQAGHEVSTALDATREGDAARRALLRMRAQIAAVRGALDEAIADLEAAHAAGDAEAIHDLIDTLDKARAQAAKAGDRDRARASSLRLAQLLGEAGNDQAARSVLATYVATAQNDVEALRLLLRIDSAAGRWAEARDTCSLLVQAEQGDARLDAVIRLADICASLGAPADARGALELVFEANPAHAAVRDRLRALYEQAGLHRELAGLYVREAETMPEDARFEPYKKAGELLLHQGGDPASALPFLEWAVRLKPADHESIVGYVDACIAVGQFEQASAMLDAAIAAHKGRRSREVAVLQQRMARLALAAGDRNVEFAWLNVALESDMQNGQIASELADLAMQLGQYDVALKALRAITMMKTPGPMSKAMAYLRQGQIAYHQGDPRKGVVLAKKALQEDASLAEARSFLEQLGEKV